jgi:hypothetical protein
VSGRDAFENGMGHMSRISDEQTELLLSDSGSGAGAGPELREVASFVRALPAAIPVRPDPAVEAPLVQRLAATARSATHEAHGAATAQIPAAAPVRPWRRRLALFARVAIAVAMVPAALAGLAIAGVSLPEPAREAFERVGIELPNQAGGDEAPAAGRDHVPGDREAPLNRGSAEAGEEDEGEGESAPSQGGGGGHGKGANPAGGKRKGHGHGAGGKNGQPQGPSGGVPPGHGGVPPGHGGTAPGPDGIPPGHGGTPPGHGGVPPGGGSGAPKSPSPGGGSSGGVPPGQAKPKKK